LITPDVTCQCMRGKRRPPLRVIPDAVYVIRPLLEHLPPDMVLMTYRCGDCQTLVELRLADLALTGGLAYGANAKAKAAKG